MHQAGAAPAGAAPAGAAPAAAGPRVRSFECDVTARVLWTRSDVDSPRPIVLSHPLSRLRPARRQFTRTPYTSVILKISTSLSDTPTDAGTRNGNRTATRADIACAPRCRRRQRRGERSLPSLAAVPRARARRPSARRARLPRSHRMDRVARRRLAVGWSLKLTRY
jgi:hypothetical protein